MNDKRKIRWQVVFLLFLIVGTVYVISTHKQVPVHQEEGAVFGTFYHVTYQYDSRLHDEIKAELSKVDFSLSPYNESSVISRVNRNEDVELDSMFMEVFELSQAVSRRTGGAFDITVAPLVNAWGFGFKNSAQVSQELVDSLLQFVGYEKIRIENGKIVKDDPRVILDCSAVAKGYGADAVARLFDRKGITNYMVEIGGEIVLKGRNPKNKKWSVGIQKPTDDSLSLQNDLQTILKVTDCAMATSGNYRNFYYKDGKKYAHTIDPHKGYPVQHSILSATVLADDCATADAYATAFMVMGLEKAKQLLDELNGLDAYFIYADEKGHNQVYMTENMRRLVDDGR